MKLNELTVEKLSDFLAEKLGGEKHEYQKLDSLFIDFFDFQTGADAPIKLHQERAIEAHLFSGKDYVASLEDLKKITHHNLKSINESGEIEKLLKRATAIRLFGDEEKQQEGIAALNELLANEGYKLEVEVRLLKIEPQNESNDPTPLGELAKILPELTHEQHMAIFGFAKDLQKAAEEEAKEQEALDAITYEARQKLQPMTWEELNERLKRAEENIASGNVFTEEEMDREMEKWEEEDDE
jgi:hypothetical protein